MRYALLMTGVGFVALAVALVAPVPAAAADGALGAAPEVEAIGAGIDRVRQPVALITAINGLPRTLAIDNRAANLHFRQVRSQTVLKYRLRAGETAATFVPIGRGAVTGNILGMRGQLRPAQLTAIKNRSYCVLVIDTRGGPVLKVVGEGRVLGSTIYAQPDLRCEKTLQIFNRFKVWR